MLRQPSRNWLISIIEGALLKELKFDKSVDELIYQMNSDKDIIGRRWAIGELSKAAKNAQISAADKSKILAAFSAKVNNDSSYLIRRAAIGEVRGIVVPRQSNPLAEPTVTIDDATAQTLLKAAKDENSLVRADAVGLLGATKDAKYADLYLSAVNDRSYSVIDNAAEALGYTKNAKAYDVLNKLANTPSWKGRIAAAGFKGLGALEDKRGLDLAFKTVADKTQPTSCSRGGVRRHRIGRKRRCPRISAYF